MRNIYALVHLCKMRSSASVFKPCALTCLMSFGLLMAINISVWAQTGECQSGGCTEIGASYGTMQTSSSTSFKNSVSGTYAGEYNTYNVTSGQQYEWSLCTTNGAVNSTANAQLTLKNTSNTNLCYSNNLCGKSKTSHEGKNIPSSS